MSDYSRKFTGRLAARLAVLGVAAAVALPLASTSALASPAADTADTAEVVEVQSGLSAVAASTVQAAKASRTALFINKVSRPAQRTQKKYRVPASVSIAQAIQESGWGSSTLTANDKNYFGIKCFGGDPGPIADTCRTYKTAEYNSKGQRYYTDSQFRVYGKKLGSFRDHARFLVENPRYAKAFTKPAKANRFARKIHQAGYATDPNYANTLISLMRSYKLYKFNKVK